MHTHTSHQILTYWRTHTHTHTHTHTERAVCTQLTHTFRPPMQLPALDNLSFNSATLHAVLYRLLPACTATHLVILCGWHPRSHGLHCSVLNVSLQLNLRRVLSVVPLLPSLGTKPRYNAKMDSYIDDLIADRPIDELCSLRNCW